MQGIAPTIIQWKNDGGTKSFCRQNRKAGFAASLKCPKGVVTLESEITSS
jgi:hypothetical protein